MAPRPATLSLSSIAAFTGLVGLEHILRPDYDPRRRFISEYAIGPYKGVMTTAFFALAAGSAHGPVTAALDAVRQVEYGEGAQQV
ncbi:MAG: DUF998 domain-containing protein [Chloroflexota bacterium]